MNGTSLCDGDRSRRHFASRDLLFPGYLPIIAMRTNWAEERDDQKSVFLANCIALVRDHRSGIYRLTAQAPATDATILPEIIIGRRPLVLLKSIPLSPPAIMLFAESCFPLKYPIVELKPLYTIAITPAEFPRNGPRLVMAFRQEFSRNFGGCVAERLRPSCSPQAPPSVSAERYVTPVP